MKGEFLKEFEISIKFLYIYILQYVKGANVDPDIAFQQGKNIRYTQKSKNSNILQFLNVYVYLNYFFLGAAT